MTFDVDTVSVARVISPRQIIVLATRQQITNALPAIHWPVCRGLILSSEFSLKQENEWPSRLQAALGYIDWEIATIPKDATHSPFAFEIWACRAIEEWRVRNEPMLFSLGGGQKIASIGLWQCFISFSQRDVDIGHLAVYPEQHTKRLVVLKEGENADFINIENTPSLSQVFQLNGYEVDDSGLLLWKEGEQNRDVLPSWLPEYRQLFENDVTFRELCFRHAAVCHQVDPKTGLSYAEYKSLFQSHARQLMCTPLVDDAMRSIDEWFIRGLPDPSEYTRSFHGKVVKRLPVLVKRIKKRLVQALLDTGEIPMTVKIVLSDKATRVLEKYNESKIEKEADGSVALDFAGVRLFPDTEIRTFGRFFEQVVFARVFDWAGTRRDIIEQVNCNVKFRRPNKTGIDAFGEWDVVILLKSGKLVVLDAKSHYPTDRTSRAQYLLVERAGGEFARRYSVVPMFTPDVTRASRWYPDALRVLHREVIENRRKTVIPYDATGAFEKFMNYAI